MPSDRSWHTDPNGELSAVVDDLRLIIRQCAGFIRYLILQRGMREIMLGSGTESDVSTAMVAAQSAAERTQFILAQRRSANSDRRARFLAQRKAPHSSQGRAHM